MATMNFSGDFPMRPGRILSANGEDKKKLLIVMHRVINKAILSLFMMTMDMSVLQTSFARTTSNGSGIANELSQVFWQLKSAS